MFMYLSLGGFCCILFLYETMRFADIANGIKMDQRISDGMGETSIYIHSISTQKHEYQTLPFHSVAFGVSFFLNGIHWIRISIKAAVVMFI